MFKLFVFACFLALAAAKPSPKPKPDVFLETPIAAYTVPEVVYPGAPIAYSSAYEYAAYSPYTYALPYSYYLR